MKSDSQYVVASLCCSFLLRLFLCSGVGSPQAAVPSGISSAPMSSYTGCRRISAPAPGAPPPPPPSLILVSAGLFLSLLFPHSTLPAQHFSVSKTHYHRGTTSLGEGLSCVFWWVCWSWLELALPDMEAASDVSSQQSSLQPLCYQNLDT